MIVQLLPFLLASMMLPPEDVAAVQAQAAAIFAPYKAEVNDVPSWERTVYSEETAALIAHWQKVMPENEPDELNDGDWFCQCQDWDQAKFAVALEPATPLTEELFEVKGKVDIGFGAESPARDIRLIFKREGAEWRLDDMVSDSFLQGLKQALRDTITTDEALRANTGKTRNDNPLESQ